MLAGCTASPLDTGSDTDSATVDTGCDPCDTGEVTVVVQPEWSVSGTYAMFSSPRLVDLNGDGVLDVVVGHGSELGGGPLNTSGDVVAHSGVDGTELWKVQARQDLVGSPALVDLTGDGVLDVVIGGRHAELLAIDGAAGTVLWQFYPDGGARELGWYNFYTPQVLADVDSDGTPDLLLSNGGDSTIFDTTTPRPAGRLLVMSGRTGEVIQWAEVPDGAETYHSPIVGDFGDGLTVVFGSGGETLPGSLWRVSLDALLAGDISEAQNLVRGEGKGSLAPVSLGDVSGDGVVDIVVMMFDGRCVALDGVTGGTLWTVKRNNTESYNTPALADFDGDGDLDVLASFHRGVWPAHNGALTVVLEGSTGAVLWEEESGILAASSHVAADLDGDGASEGLLSITVLGDEGLELELQLVDLEQPGWTTPVSGILGNGIAGPRLGDVDGDGILDVALGHTSFYDQSEDAWGLSLYSLGVPVPDTIAWGGYLGTDADGQAK